MLDFDIKIQKLINECSGYYRRYSDDILIIVDTKEKLEKILLKMQTLLLAEVLILMQQKADLQSMPQLIILLTN